MFPNYFRFYLLLFGHIFLHYAIVHTFMGRRSIRIFLFMGGNSVDSLLFCRRHFKTTTKKETNFSCIIFSLFTSGMRRITWSTCRNSDIVFTFICVVEILFSYAIIEFTYEIVRWFAIWSKDWEWIEQSSLSSIHHELPLIWCLGSHD